MGLLALSQNVDVMSMSSFFHALFSSERGAVDSDIAICVIRNLVTVNKSFCSSALVTRHWKTLLGYAMVMKWDDFLFWSCKRLHFLQQNHPTLLDMYAHTFLMCIEVTPSMSTFNTNSEIHCIMRNQFSRRIQALRILPLIHRELDNMVRQQDTNADMQLRIFNSILFFLQRCVGITGGALSFLESGLHERHTITGLGNLLILCHDKVEHNVDAIFHTVMEALCSSSSVESVETIFEHLLQTFMKRYFIVDDNKVSFLQGCLVRIINSSFGDRRRHLRRLLEQNDMIGELATCIHNNPHASVNKHVSGLCLFSELIAISTNLDMPSFEKTVQLIINCLNNNKMKDITDVHLLTLRQLVQKRTRPVSRDLVDELVEILTREQQTKDVDLILSIAECLIKHNRQIMSIASCHKLTRWALNYLVLHSDDMLSSTRCVAILRTFIHQLNRLSILNILQQGSKLINMLNMGLDVQHAAQILYVFRYAVCRLSSNKDVISQCISDSQCIPMLLDDFHGHGIPTYYCRRVDVARIRLMDIFISHELITAQAPKNTFLHYCTRCLKQYHKNHKTCVDILRIILRCLHRAHSRGDLNKSDARDLVWFVTQQTTQSNFPDLRIALSVLQCIFCECDQRCFRCACCHGTESDQSLCSDALEFCMRCVKRIFPSNVECRLQTESLTMCMTIMFAILEYEQHSVPRLLNQNTIFFSKMQEQLTATISLVRRLRALHGRAEYKVGPIANFMHHSAVLLQWHEENVGYSC